MAKRSAVHSTFVVERVYPASPAHVFVAWSDPTIKAQWFGAPDEGETNLHEFDFRVGGRESSSGGAPNGQSYSYDARYQDIVPNQRIVYSYDMHLDGVRISVSLSTIEIAPEGTGTRLTLTEQGVYLDGLDTPAQREEGTIALMKQLRLYQTLPQAELAVIPNADHGAGETPLFWQAVQDFLSRHA